jgi:hypothetical protein
VSVAEQLKKPGFNKRTVSLESLEGIEMLPVRWLLKGFIPAGMFGLMPGREGIGKSLLYQDYVAQITTGTMPGDFHGQVRDVIICATEDSYAQVIVPRLKAAGAALSRVHRIKVKIDETENELNLPVDIDSLSELIRRHQVVLVVLDPLLPRLSAKLDSYKDAEVRRALEPLAKMADDTQCAILGLIHINKSSGGDPLNSIMGSRAFPAAARYVIHVVLDPKDETQRLVGLSKCNVAPTDGPLKTFTITPVSLTNRTGVHIETVKITWGEDDKRSLREVCTAASNGRGNPRERAAEWMFKFLQGCQDQKALSIDVKAAALEAGFKDRTVQRAAHDALKVLVVGGGPKTTWRLRPDATPQRLPGV